MKMIVVLRANLKLRPYVVALIPMVLLQHCTSLLYNTTTTYSTIHPDKDYCVCYTILVVKKNKCSIYVSKPYLLTYAPNYLDKERK